MVEQELSSILQEVWSPSSTLRDLTSIYQSLNRKDRQMPPKKKGAASPIKKEPTSTSLVPVTPTLSVPEPVKSELDEMKKDGEKNKQDNLSLAKEMPTEMYEGIKEALIEAGVKESEIEEAMKYVLPPEVWQELIRNYYKQKPKNLVSGARTLPAPQQQITTESQKKRFKKLAGILKD